MSQMDGVTFLSGQFLAFDRLKNAINQGDGIWSGYPDDCNGTGSRRGG